MPNRINNNRITTDSIRIIQYFSGSRVYFIKPKYVYILVKWYCTLNMKRKLLSEYGMKLRMRWNMDANIPENSSLPQLEWHISNNFHLSDPVSSQSLCGINTTNLSPSSSLLFLSLCIHVFSAKLSSWACYQIYLLPLVYINLLPLK